MYALSKRQRDRLHLQEFEDFKLRTLLEATFDKEESQNPGGPGAHHGHTANSQGSWDWDLDSRNFTKLSGASLGSQEWKREYLGVFDNLQGWSMS